MALFTPSGVKRFNNCGLKEVAEVVVQTTPSIIKMAVRCPVTEDTAALRGGNDTVRPVDQSAYPSEFMKKMRAARKDLAAFCGEGICNTCVYADKKITDGLGVGLERQAAAQERAVAQQVLQEMAPELPASEPLA
ncbi:MAG TPA: hypothetical protein VGE30_03535 [Candidatus Saccharimonadales bacterium]